MVCQENLITLYWYVCFAMIERKLKNTVIIHLCIWFHAHTCINIFFFTKQTKFTKSLNE